MNEKRLLLEDTQHGINVKEEITKIRDESEKQRRLVENIISEENAELLLSITTVVDEYLAREIDLIKKGEVSSQMYDPPMRTFPRVMEEHPDIDDATAHESWKKFRNFSSNLHSAVASKATIVDDGEPLTRATGITMGMGLIEPKVRPRIDILSEKNLHLNSLSGVHITVSAASTQDFVDGRLRLGINFDSTSVPIGAEKAGGKWIWRKREDVGLYKSDTVERILANPEAWVEGSGHKDNKSLRDKLLYLQEEREELESNNRELEKMIESPESIAGLIKDAYLLQNRLMTKSEYEQLRLRIKELQEYGNVATLPIVGYEDYAAYIFSTQKPEAVDFYSTNDETRAHPSETEVLVSINDVGDEVIGYKTFSIYHSDRRIFSSRMGSAFSLKHMLDYWHNHKKTAWNGSVTE